MNNTNKVIKFKGLEEKQSPAEATDLENKVTFHTESVTMENKPSFLSQVGLLLKRNFLIDLGNARILFWDVLIQSLAGIGLGIPFIGKVDYPSILPIEVANICPDIMKSQCLNHAQNENIILNPTFYLTMVGAVVSTIYSVRTFGRFQFQVNKEIQKGLNVYSYWTAMILYDLIHIVRNVLTFLAWYFVLAAPRGTFGGWFVLIFALYFAAFGVGYFVSLVTPYDRATTLAVVLAVGLSVTTGLYPELSQVNNWTPLNWFWYISYNRWTAEGYTNLVYYNAPNPDRVAYIVNQFGFTYGRFGLDIGLTILIGIIWRFTTLIILLNKKFSKPTAH
jgi:hypothetical protein